MPLVLWDRLVLVEELPAHKDSLVQLDLMVFKVSLVLLEQLELVLLVPLVLWDQPVLEAELQVLKALLVLQEPLVQLEQEPLVLLVLKDQLELMVSKALLAHKDSLELE